MEVRQAYDHVDSFAHEMDLFSTLIVILILIFHVLYSASNLERQFLCFVVSKNVFCYKNVTVIAIKLKSAMNVHTPMLIKYGR